MVRPATLNDCRVLAELAARMWDHDAEALAEDFAALLKSGSTACFLQFVQDTPIGFAQCSLRRDYVEGTSTSPVGYLEGVFIEEPYRKSGYARELLCACENWAKQQGCTEFASDCELTNGTSLAFHLAVGFEEANRIICFRKTL